MKLRLATAAVLIAALAAIVAIAIVDAAAAPRPDTVALNDLRHRLENRWEHLSVEDLVDEHPVGGHPVGERPAGGHPAGGHLAVAVLNLDGSVRVATAGAPTDELNAASAGAAVLPVLSDGSRVGTLIAVDQRFQDANRDRQRRITWIAIGAVLAIVAVSLVTLAWLRTRLLRPFDGWRAFATRVASGDLDTPLVMDRGNAFGAFTEAFDLMRSELAAGQEREEALQQSKRDLVSHLSHDIRTPVASISALAELLELGEADPKRAERLGTIVAKSAQIDELVAELYRANDDQLVNLHIDLAEHTSDELATLVTAADLVGRVVLDPAPPCVLRYDERRVRQVLDNVLNNATKYAGTQVDAAWTLHTDQLRLTLADRGPGVAAHEVGTLLGRGVRGSNVGDAPGQGLGLHTSAMLMERMGGTLAVRNTDRGFAVDLDIRLAGGPADK